MKLSNVLPNMEALEPRLLLSGSSLDPQVMGSAATIDMPCPGQTSMSNLIATPGQSTLYSFTAKAKGKLSVDMNADGSVIDSYVQVYDSRGRLVARNDNASRRTKDSHLQINVSAGQTYYVRASSARNTTGTYKLGLDAIPKDEYGDDIAHAATWRVNRYGNGLGSGWINYNGDIDVLKVTAARDGSMRIDMSPYSRSSTVVGALVVTDASGQQLAINTNDANAAQLSVQFNVTAGQVYYIAVAGHAGSIGHYVLKASSGQAIPIVVPDPTPLPAPPDGGGNVPTGEIAPGTSVFARVQEIAGGLQLIVLGTDQADTVTISQTATAISMITLAGTQSFQGAFTSLVMYGFGGDDVLRLVNTVTASAVIYGGAGNDVIYDAGQGSDKVYGDEGNDTVVSIGGGKDAVYGGDGQDSFWVDSIDTLPDYTSAESAAGTVHKVAAFYQPYATDSSSPQYVSLEVAGQNLTDPTLTGDASGYRNFASSPLFANGPQYSDIRQGALGDCYLLSSLASIADQDPTVITQMVTPLGDGTYAVRFYRNGKAVFVRVDADLAVNGSSPAYAKLSPTGETWVAIVEKAYAYLRYGENTFESIEGGWMGTVYQEVTNTAYGYCWGGGSAADMATYLTTNLNAGHAVTAATYVSTTNPLVGNHAYMVKSVETVAGVTYVTVYNPWGVDGKSYDSNSSDGLLRLSMSTFMQNFTAVAVCLV